MRERRIDDGFRLTENKRRAYSLKTARQSGQFKKGENKKRAAALQIARQDDQFKEGERRKNALRMHNSRSQYRNSFADMKVNYELKVKEGPTHICSCCGGL